MKRTATHRLDGIRALVTGGTSGIGLAVVEAFLREGAEVVAVGRGAYGPPRPGEARRTTADVRDDAQVRTAVVSAVDALGGLDVLVTAAGVASVGTVAEASDDEWARVLDVNVTGTARFCRAAWPHLAASDHAAVVVVGSMAAAQGYQERAVYGASKGAVTALARAMAADGLRDGVRVNVVHPGTADTPWVDRLVASSQDPGSARNRLTARQPHGRLVGTEEIAEAVLLLSSPVCGSLTGAELAVDGGGTSLRPQPTSPTDQHQGAP
ncbi:SDR family oxidoreductase [Streptomyces sp. NA04227]|uniref:SDR family NAD(P)-dependent oxidoreductase n=1 Tax=Streptomyces sp. NA04227 TaxID=2742136 RepID=UPI001590A1DB|nr:SDR family oxidoreductase [Streptomyces sp. NA04227]QKW10371.1 SDR family oxidoreductase [Streptomyces sp. NA04227]